MTFGNETFNLNVLKWKYACWYVRIHPSRSNIINEKGERKIKVEMYEERDLGM